MKSMWLVVAVAGAGLLGGCDNRNYLSRQTVTSRAHLTDDTLPATAPAPTGDDAATAGQPTMGAADGKSGTATSTDDSVGGTWTFTTPATVTRVEKRTGEISQISLYQGRPSATDTPFVVITVSPDNDSASQAESDPAIYTVTSTRQYVLNGNVAKEWIGKTHGGGAFCELLIKKPSGKGDICHAIAVARTETQRKEALAILGSIIFKTE